MNNNLFEEQYKMLNTAQKEAVDEVYGQIMVVAGPGTGKTQIIGLRTANIIKKTWVNPSNILITTFTEAGVIAIRERLARFIGNEAYKVGVSTIHSLSQDIIKTHPEKFLEYKAMMAIDEVDSLEALKEITDKLIEEKKIVELTNDYDRYFYLRDIKSKIQILKQEWINKAKLEIAIEKQTKQYSEELAEIKPTLKKYETTKNKGEKHIAKLKELVIFFEEYQKYLRSKSLYDFNDMINFVLEKLREDKELRQYYAEKYQFIMLDEYQDTNDAQNQIIDLILSVSIDKSPLGEMSDRTEGVNIMVVGDDDQSIYRFQGANIENMLDFSTKYKNTKFIVLENNYRSNQQILDLSSELIDNNNERLSKKIKSINKKLISSWNLKDSNTEVWLFKANSDIEEKTFIVNKIKNEIKKGTPLEEIAIIVRWNKEVEEWSNLLLQNKIEAESKLKTNILNSKYVNLLLNYLEIISNPYADEEKLINIMRSNISKIENTDIFKINRKLYISNYSKKHKIKMLDFLMKAEEDDLNLKNKELLDEFIEKLWDFQTKIGELSIVEFFSYFIEKTWLLEYIETHGNFDDIQDIYTIFNKIKDYANLDKNFSIEKLLKKIELFKNYNYPITRQIVSETSRWIQVLTAHSSKWLEYNTVFIPWLYNWNWEWKTIRDKLKLPEHIAWEWLQTDSFEQIEEDRRLFFVAVTRARENLYLSYPAWIWTKPLLQSVFIQEIEWSFEEITPPATLSPSMRGIKGDLEIKQIIENDIKNELIEYGDREFNYIHSFLENYKLSASDLNTFLEDPLLFLNRVVFKYPFIDNQFTIFGKVYHRTLELFYLKYKNESSLPEKSYLTTTFKMLLDKEVLTPEEHEKLLEKGIVWLEWYFDNHIIQKEEPLVLEYSFRNRWIVFEWIPLTGTIDKIDKVGTSTPDNSNNEGQLAFFKETVVLIDYKTWKIKSEWVIKWLDRYWNKKPGEWKYFRQLMFYRLLCELDHEFAAKFDVWWVAIDFVEWKDWKYKYIELEISDEEYSEFKEEVKQAWKDINCETFWKELLKK